MLIDCCRHPSPPHWRAHGFQSLRAGLFPTQTERILPVLSRLRVLRGSSRICWINVPTTSSESQSEIGSFCMLRLHEGRQGEAIAVVKSPSHQRRPTKSVSWRCRIQLPNARSPRSPFERSRPCGRKRVGCCLRARYVCLRLPRILSQS